MDDGLGATRLAATSPRTSRVSILLVMDDGLGATLEKFGHIQVEIVSILLVMDDGLGVWGHNMRPNTRRRSQSFL